MVLKRIGPLSCAKLSGALYAALGLIGGVFFALASLAGVAAERSEGAVFGAIFGVGAIVFFPVLYGVIGFVGALIAAALYNWLAGLLGGIELELHET